MAMLHGNRPTAWPMEWLHNWLKIDLINNSRCRTCTYATRCVCAVFLPQNCKRHRRHFAYAWLLSQMIERSYRESLAKNQHANLFDASVCIMHTVNMRNRNSFLCTFHSAVLLQFIAHFIIQRLRFGAVMRNRRNEFGEWLIGLLGWL